MKKDLMDDFLRNAPYDIHEWRDPIFGSRTPYVKLEKRKGFIVQIYSGANGSYLILDLIDYSNPSQFYDSVDVNSLDAACMKIQEWENE